MARDRPRFHIERGEPLSSGSAGRACAQCGRPASRCECRPGAARSGARRKGDAPAPHTPPADGIVRVSRQTQGRKGKGVTLITGLSLAPDELAALCKQLKQRCGAGGTSKDGVIEIQGDHRDLLVAELEAQGHTVKRAGG